MAQRVKTVEYAFDTRATSLASDTRYDTSSKTLTIAETSSRTFRSVTLEVTARDDSTTAVSATAWMLGIALGATAAEDTTVTDTMTNSGEHQTWKFTKDCTAYFQANFGSGSTQTCVASFKLTGLASINITAKLIITYECADSSTRTRTARIPLDSLAATLTNSLQTVGGSGGIPKLTGSGGFLPEASVSVKDLWIEIEGNEATTVTTDWQLGMDIDSGAENLDGTHQQDLQSAVLYKYIWSQPSLDPTASHTLRLRGTVTGMMSCCSVVVYVTYTYDHSTSTRVLNSLALPFGMMDFGPGNGNSPSHWRHNLEVCEPGTITLLQSGVLFHYTLAAGVTAQLSVGSQAMRNYVMVEGSMGCGGHSTSHRLDSGAAAGSGGLSLAAGDNTIDVKVASASINSLGGIVYLNYSSDVADNGDGEHNHTTHWIQLATAADIIETILESGTAPLTTPNIPEATYKIGHAAAGMVMMVNSGAPVWGIEWGDNGSTGSRGRRLCGAGVPIRDGELGIDHCYANLTPYVKKSPTDPAFDVLDIETQRTFRLYTIASAWKSLAMWLTYRAMPRTVAGTVSGYTGDGSGIAVEIFNANDELVATATTSAGGGYTATVYDERTHYAIARQDSTHVGRSDDATPT